MRRVTKSRGHNMVAITILLAALLASCSAVIQVILPNASGDTCTNWTPWEQSVCFSTAIDDYFSLLPPGCRNSGALNAMLELGAPYATRVVRYFNAMNNSAGACGMCNMRYSCSSQCANGNPFGIRDQVCTELPGYDNACPLTSATPIVNGECRPWPPPQQRQTEFVPLLLRADMRNSILNAKPFNCISIDNTCYCCCAPYSPDPCTAKCTLSPCYSRTSYSTLQIQQLRQHYLTNIAPSNGGG